MRKGARAANQGLSKALSAIMPKGLYVRALVIVIAPMILLQSILAYVFMERHWQTVTERLSAALSQDIAALVDLNEALGPGKHDVLERIAAERLNLDVELMPPIPLPPPAPKPFFHATVKSCPASTFSTACSSVPPGTGQSAIGAGGGR